MVWGGICNRNKTPFVFIDGNLNSQRYIDNVLQPLVRAFLRNMEHDAVLQDDNARPHRARIVLG